MLLNFIHLAQGPNTLISWLCGTKQHNSVSLSCNTIVKKRKKKQKAYKATNSSRVRLFFLVTVHYRWHLLLKQKMFYHFVQKRNIVVVQSYTILSTSNSRRSVVS